MQIVIQSVNAGPQVDPRDGGFQTDNGFVHVTEWMCSAEDDSGTAYENIKVRVGAKSAGTEPHMAKYVVPGGILVANKRGIQEHNGKYEVYAASKETKEANGDGYSGGGQQQGNTQQQPAQGGTQPTQKARQAAPAGSYTFAGLGALYGLCHDTAIELVGKVGDAALVSVANKLFGAALASGIKAPVAAPAQAAVSQAAQGGFAPADAIPEGWTGEANIPF